MALEPPVPENFYYSLPDLLKKLNEHAGPQGYAVVLLRTKTTSEKIPRKAWIICDRGRKIRAPIGRERRHGTSRHVECPFSIIATSTNKDAGGPWVIEVKNPEHNHVESAPGAHPVLRRMAMTSEVKSEMTRQLTIQTAPSKVLSAVRIDDPLAANAMFTSRDVYNLQAQIRRDELGPLTPIQALIREFDEGDWIYALQKNENNQITHLFFTKRSSQEILKTNHEVLIMDTTYKTNRFKMPLLIISGSSALHTNFYVAFCFIAQEKTPDYTFAMEQMKSLYETLELPPPTVAVTDMERSLINAIREAFPLSHTTHLLCIWHINKNVLVNCRKDFANKEEWEEFFADWTKIIYAPLRVEYEERWESFKDKYYEAHYDCVDYLTDTYIRDFKTRFVKCYTNKVRHFETTVTSRSEGGHAVFKKWLGTSTGDLKKVVDAINLLLINQAHNHALAVANAKVRFPKELRLPIFQHLAAHVSSYALKKIAEQYHMLIDRPTVLLACTHVFTTTTGLPCSHKIQSRLYSDGALMLEDVHVHWR